MTMKPSTVAVMWLLSFGVMAIVIGFAMDMPRVLLLQRAHAETSGQVTRLLPDNHGLVRVRYLVAGAAYEGTFPPYVQGRRVDKGDVVRVYYSPRDPAVAFIAPPDEVLSDRLPFLVVASLLGSVGLTAGALAMWNPRAVLHRPCVWVISPRILSAGVTVGVLGGLVSSLYSGTLDTAKSVGGAFVVCGCAVFLTLAWRHRLSWAALLRSGAFWIAVALVIVGNIFNAAF